MRKLISMVTAIGTVAMLALGALPAQAADTAGKKVVLQISDGSPAKQTLVLNVANNLRKHYGDDIDLEIVAFGPGLKLLFNENANNPRVQNLAASGVRFSACQNTTRKMTKILGEKPNLSEHATPVAAGVARILDLIGDGYTLIRP